MKPEFPSLDLTSAYPLHDKDGELEFVLGMWFHTREIVGVPTVQEVVATLPDWPAARRQELIETLARNRQVIA